MIMLEKITLAGHECNYNSSSEIRPGAIIRGYVPEDSRLAGQRSRLGGCELGRWPVGPGAFTLRFAAPVGGKGSFLFEVRAARYKRPRLAG